MNTRIVNWLKKYFYFLPVLVYLPALGNFFSADDWFHLRISQIDSFQQFFSFFSFAQNYQTASFYRPLSTQVFFFIFQKLFGLTAWPYYLFGLFLFAYSVYLVFKFSSSRLAAFIYAISVSNFTRVYFLSAYQELFLVVFSLLALINFKKSPRLSLLFFILALLSKETAIVIPSLLIILNLREIRNHKIYLTSVVCSSAIYLYLRLFHFGLAAGDSYLWDFSPVRAGNTLMWYVLWSFGAPELLVDYVGTGLRLIPRFFTDYQYWWPIIIFPLLGLIGATGILAIKKAPSIKFILFFVVASLPVLFLPSHKFTLELGLPIISFSIILASIIPNKFNILSFCFFAFLIFTNLSMNYLTYIRHYSVSRGKISKKVYQYFSQNQPSPPAESYFKFINDTNIAIKDWGSSRQIYNSIQGSEMLRYLYQDRNYKIYFEDIKESRPTDKTEIEISTKRFLGT